MKKLSPPKSGGMIMRVFVKALAVFAISILVPLSVSGDQSTPASISQAPLRVISALPDHAGAIEVRFDSQTFDDLKSMTGRFVMPFPISERDELLLELEPFDVLASDVKVYMGSPGGDEEIIMPRVAMFRGKVAGEDGSHAYIAFTEQGSGNGYVTLDNGQRYVMAHSAARIAAGRWGEMIIHCEDAFSDLPSDEPFCGVEVPDGFEPFTDDPNKSPHADLAGPRVALVAVDCDQEYCDIFDGNVYAGAAYALQVIGAVSDIYQRDIGIRLELRFVRLWPDGGEPFTATSLSGFASHWWDNEDYWDYNLIQLFSGRRNLGYGGIGYVGWACPWESYAVEGRFNGSFPVPTGETNRANWDIIVVAHEMGHNFGTYHTHDGFSPTIDECGNGLPSRGTIMSYCHIHPGYALNMDLRFHARVREVIHSEFNYNGCENWDCNQNGVFDYEDIALGTSDDVNNNDVPDECEDCNGNDTLDYIDITSGSESDVNSNGVPDACEPDCNDNDFPDRYEVESGAFDIDGNNVPDECDPDCNANGFSDLVEVWIQATPDIDRNVIPDDCQDCDGNDVSDWIDLERQYNLYVSDQNQDHIREYHGASGVPIRNFGDGHFSRPSYLTFGPDNRLYVSDMDADCIMQLDVDNDVIITFVSSGSGGLDQPQGLIFKPDGNLLVASQLTNSIIEYDGSSGIPVGDFVTSGTGGLYQPEDIIIGPNGNLFVASLNNTVLEYDIDDGSFLGEFVTAGSGGLDSPKGIAFKLDGNLLVASNNTNRILEYEASTGAFIRQFNMMHTEMGGQMDITIGPDGLPYVMNGGNQWIIAYFPHSGLFYGGFVRNDPYLIVGCGLVFRPQSSNDCNGNGVLDQCDIAGGYSQDTNTNGVPDECEDPDLDDDGVDNETDNCPLVYNPGQEDSDSDNIGDACDNCAATQNVGQGDWDGDGVGDLCDICPGHDDNVDADGDGVADGCDACPGYDDTLDDDGDGVPNDCDICPDGDDYYDSDFDGLADGCDNCPDSANENQADSDGDGNGNVCDLCPGYDDNLDADGDGAPDDCDICPGYDDFVDTDGDGYPDGCDICPGYHDDLDVDGDTHADSCDNCPLVYNLDQADSDEDGIGDVCDYICGDANGDRDINIGDAVYLINHIFKGGPGPDPVEAGDANCDGQVNVGDAVYLIAFVFNGGPDPCCPY
jgi:hypothetical protein